ncbi:hypothetical protein CEXT_176221 [Caerostris extrusa]|uniref:Uncharacterized protein n=1 Tax=Caerostris extrusa TaxID=172846 RepID=A0AAV4URT5_CAEEX|nr:hypothetical protein CEXT_176221 [Caerostris extrusa]
MKYKRIRRTNHKIDSYIRTHLRTYLTSHNYRSDLIERHVAVELSILCGAELNSGRWKDPWPKEGRFAFEFQILFFIGSAAALLCGGFSRQDHSEDFSQEFEKTFPPTQAQSMDGCITKGAWPAPVHGVRAEGSEGTRIAVAASVIGIVWPRPGRLT